MKPAMFRTVVTAALVACSLASCHHKPVPVPLPVDAAPSPGAKSPAVEAATARTDEAPGTAAPATAPAAEPAPALPSRADPAEARKMLDALRALAARGETTSMGPFLFGKTRTRVARMKPADVVTLLSGEVGAARVDGGRVLLALKGNPKAKQAVFFLTDSGFKYDPDTSLTYREPDPGPRVPENRDLSLADALKGLGDDVPDGTRTVFAAIETSAGTFQCELFPDKAPLAVANFVALARGLRGFRDVKTGKWVKRPFFDGLTFHRVIPKFMIQGGCPKGTGAGDPGYSFKDEFDLSLRHDRPGRLSLANSGPNTNGSQFFITEMATPWLDDHHTILGQCEPGDLVYRMARVPATSTKPNEPLVIKGIHFRRTR